MLHAGLSLKELEQTLPAPGGDALTTGQQEDQQEEETESSEDDNLPPLHRNTNRPIREYEYTDDETSSEEES